jgi:Zn-dependent peptidase ImmA (M78 family)
MYWGSNDYDEIAKLVIDIYLDYGINKFPIDEKLICEKLGVKLIPYSAYNEEEMLLLMKKSEDGFYTPATAKTPPTIFYNDTIQSYARQRYTIFHELKHYVNGDSDDCTYNDNMADYFARYFLCPVPYLIKKGIDNKLSLISDHLISSTVADNTMKNVQNRRAKYGDKIFDYEQPLIDLLCPDLF